MSIKLIDNILLKSKHRNKPFISDVHFADDGALKPVIIFIHGLKGFKDWGHWNLIAQHFAKAGFVFCKMNLSHNGTTPDIPLDFADLEAFGENNFSIELDDVGVFIDYLFNVNDLPKAQMDLNQLSLIGHSRGGGIAILKTREEKRIKKLITWASVDDYAERWPKDELEQWKEDGVRYMFNGRTGQNMPQKYQLVENYFEHQNRLDIKKAVKLIDVPSLFIHGSKDETVHVQSAEVLTTLCPKGQCQIIDGANHVFGGRHPFDGQDLPQHSQELVSCTIDWLNS